MVYSLLEAGSESKGDGGESRGTVPGVCGRQEKNRWSDLLRTDNAKGGNSRQSRNDGRIGRTAYTIPTRLYLAKSGRANVCF